VAKKILAVKDLPSTARISRDLGLLDFSLSVRRGSAAFRFSSAMRFSLRGLSFCSFSFRGSFVPFRLTMSFFLAARSFFSAHCHISSMGKAICSLATKLIYLARGNDSFLELV
jgi:hypothetical protein